MKRKVFKSRKLFYTYIKSVCEKFDLFGSFKPSRFSYYDTDGNIYKNRNFPLMLESINKLIGKGHFDTRNSRCIGMHTYTVMVEEGKSKVEEATSIEAETLLKELLDSEVVIKEGGVLDKEDVVTPKEQEGVFDWIKWGILEGTKEDKKALDKYAKTQGIKLNQAMKYTNMLKAFKKATNK